MADEEATTAVWSEFRIGNSERQDGRIVLAKTLVSYWGMHATQRDGESSNGQTRWRLETPAEIVKRACDTADLFQAEIVNRGWLKSPHN